jgi:hypothetical protein
MTGTDEQACEATRVTHIRGIGWCVAAAVLATALVTAQSSGEGEITGRIVDSAGGVVPGVTVTVNGGDTSRMVYTDAGGEFRVGMLKPGRYQVTADLQAFTPVSGTVTLTPQVRRAHLSWTLNLPCLSEPVTVFLTARQFVPNAKAIVRVRIRSAGERMLMSSRPECEPTEAESYAVEVLRTDLVAANAGDRSPALEILTAPVHRPLATGGEYLVVLGGPSRVAGGLILPIVSGRIAAPDETTLNGMQVDEAVKTLLSWARQPEPITTPR